MGYCYCHASFFSSESTDTSFGIQNKSWPFCIPLKQKRPLVMFDRRTLNNIKVIFVSVVVATFK